MKPVRRAGSVSVYAVALVGAVAGVALMVAGLVEAPSRAEETVGDVKAGRAVAKRWCADCHVVSEGQRRQATDAAPTFDEIAAKKDVTRDKLRAVIANPHGKMPTQALSRDDIEHVITYILSLRPAR